MKIGWIGSGLAALLLLTLLMAAGGDLAAQKAAWQGNKHYEAAKYEQALQAYEAGLAEKEANPVLLFNAAQAAYMLGDYEKALTYYEKCEDSVEKYINAGNICFWSAEAAQEESQKAQLYGQALLLYEEGIRAFPQNVPLKYNYELVKEKVELAEQNQEQEQENNNQGEEGESQESQEQQSEEQEGQEQEGQEQKGQEQEEQDQEQQDQEQQGQEQDSQDQDEQESQAAQPQDADQSGEEQPDQEAIERILQMLERQEEQSLKNNQEVKGGNEDKNGW